MNKRGVLLLMLFACLIPLSVWADYDISVNRTNLTFGSASSSEAVAITSNDSWTVSSDNSWCTVSLSNGNYDGTVTISVSENTAKYARSAVVTLKGSHAQSVTVYVTQDGTTGIGRDDYGDDKDLDLDTVPPILLQSIPTDGAVNMVTKGKIVLTFDEAIKIADNLKATLNGKQLNSPYIGSAFISFNFSGLDYNKEYTFVLPANSVSDLSGNYLKEDIRLTFTTEDDYSEEPGELTLTLTPNRIEEGTEEYVKLIVKRSGKWSNAETVNLKSNEDSRISVPPTITIPARQSAAVAYLSISNNEVVDKDSVVEITAMSDKYKPVTARLLIEDDDFPQLIVTSSKSVVSEGETFQLTVSTDRVTSAPIEITLTSENTKRFTYPRKAIIPAGKTSVTVDVVAVDNEEIELKESIAFHASADKYERGECMVLLTDNDMPTLTFILSPEAVSESDGYAALFGVIKRTDNLDKWVTLKLSDDSNGLLTYANQTIVMAKNQAEVQFNIGVTNNDLVDGNHVVNVTAAVYASSCDCSVSGDNKGYMTAKVTIIDDDGPTLKIKPAGTAMLEGSEGNVFAISHNVQSDADVTVHVSSDKDDMLEYDHELIIPAGQSSANLLVNVKSNYQQDDSSIATFKAEANGYSLGTCWILITDQTLPDATVALYADKTEVEAEGTVLLRAVVKNVGNTPLRSSTPVEILFSGRSEKVKLTVDKNVTVGDSAVIEYNYDLPAIIGNHTFEAIVNASGKVPELIYANNTSEKVGISVISPFSVTAQADKDVYLQDDSIHVMGTATGNAGKNAKIEVYFINEGARQTVSVTSDDEGNYSVAWKPLGKQSGHFIVGACYPDSKATEEMDAFDIYGIRTKDNFKTYELSQIETVTGKIILSNPGNLNQSGLKVTPQTDSENCDFSFNAPNAIGAGESVEIAYTVKANEISEGGDWQQMPIEITTVEGSHANYTIYYYVHPLKARLQANKTTINTTMTFGTAREYPVTICNVGKAETGKITLALPNWIQAVTPSEMASLAQGDSTTIVLRFIPTDAMKLNVRVSGNIGINCANGDGTFISFNLTPVSEEKGRLKVDVVDEYTYFTAEAPHVSKAKVKVKNPSTNKVVVEGETADDGTFTAEIPEGYYSVTVDADKHDSYANTVIVDPGVEKEEEVFLSYQAITYSWDVVETEIEDEYEIETVAKFETRVPKPVVVISLPNEKPEPYNIIPIVAINKGLVNALDFNLSLSVSKEFMLEFLNEYAIDSIAPQQSHVFYAKMVPVSNDEGASARRTKKTEGCLFIRAHGTYKEPCLKYDGIEHSIAEKYWGECEIGNSGSGNNTGGPSGGPSGGGYSSYGSYYYLDNVASPTKICDDDVPPCDSEINPVFKLVHIDNVNREMKGVAADGVSKVKIVLDEQNSKMPTVDCDGNKLEYHWQWHLSENIGKLDNDTSLTDVIYTAPKDFPSQTGSFYPIEASLSCTVNGRGMHFRPVTIKIVRVPLVLLHGLNSSSGTWMNFYMYLVNSGLYDSWQILCKDYSNTSCSHFSENVDKPGLAIDSLLTTYFDNKYVASKADLIGHSMGGILSRLHVQKGNNKNVHKVITVNTPHSGSEWGDLVSHYKKLQTIAYLCKFTSMDAINDLAVNSSVIDNELNNEKVLSRMDSIPVHSVTSVSSINSIVNVSTFIPIIGWPVTFVKTLINLGYYEDFASALSESDLVVPLESQKGGLKGMHTTIIRGGILACHTMVTKNPTDMLRLSELLKASVSSPLFSQTGFHPVNRHYNDFTSNTRIALNRMQSNIVEGEPIINLNVDNDSLFVDIVPNHEKVEKISVTVDFSDYVYIMDSYKFALSIPAAHEGFVNVNVLIRDNKDGLIIGKDSIYVPASPTKLPTNIDGFSDLHMFVGDMNSVHLICTYDDGSEKIVSPDKMEIKDEMVAQLKNGVLYAYKPYDGTIKLYYKGLAYDCQLHIQDYSENRDEDSNDNSTSICSSVTLSFKQKNVMTRQAFRGTLTVNNGYETTAMKDVKINLEIRDMDSYLMTSHEFQIDAESLNGFTGNLDLTSGWTLEGGGTGVATILFIPTKYAAPTESKDYSFGGSFSYSDPYTGLTVTRDLNPVTLTVNPSPDLELTYLMERDVYGDDPLTEDVVEPMKEAEFALIINNKGNGEAKNVRMLTEQPKIVENEKGLFIDFDIVSSQVNGEPANLSLGQTIANDFGTIGARSQAYAQWWLRSTLLGHFTSYEVQATHVTSYGNADLSLVDTVTIHEMVHGFTPISKGGRAFLVNDIVDADEMPDVVYFTDATQRSLYMATGSIERLSDMEFRLTATAKQAGWNYGSVTDPTGGRRKLVRIVRQSDGAELPVDNVWQTDRTLRDGRDWLYENRLHFVGDMQNGSETYVLTFEERPEVELAVQEFIGVPPEGTILQEPLSELTVSFNKPIKSETFTADDITLHCQGVKQDASLVGIKKQSETDYVLNFDVVNRQSGYWVLTVQTAGITDDEGFNGKEGRSAAWIQYLGETQEQYFYVTTTPAGYATFYDSQWNYVLPAELSASVISSASENKLTYTALDGKVVPKGVPVMLTSNPKQAGTYTLTGTESEAVYSGANLLRGSDVPTMAIPEDGERLYKLAYGPSGTKWSEVFGWYWGAENGGAFQIEGHKAWLAVPTGVARTRGYVVDGKSVETDGQQIFHMDMYDLLGRKVSLEPARRLHKGVYIQNRKKVIIK